MKLFDTIAAISTPVGQGGIAIIRISGENFEDLLSRIITVNSGKRLGELESHKLTLSKVHRIDNEAKIIDEALVAIMRAPNSYTGETVAEINCHGGFFVARVILDMLIELGIRLAEPGEFTRRAFVNGKIDLTKAEAVMDVINSNSKLGLENSGAALSGRLSEKINGIRERALYLAANLSAIADFPDEIEEMESGELSDKILSIKNAVRKMIDGFETGKIMRDGICTVIAGRPNVGKSSVLNSLARFERAIVTDIPGTTRDIVEEYINIRGISLRLLDTAGIRESEDIVERIGIERAVENLKTADLCLFVLDVSCGLTDEDIKIYNEIETDNIIVILNKTDKTDSETDIADYVQRLNISEDSIVLTSNPKGKEAIGIDKLENAIESKFIENKISYDDVYITDERQRESLVKAERALDRMIESINTGMPQDMLYVDLEDVIEALGEITGETVQEEIIEQVFEKFCVGK